MKELPKIIKFIVFLLIMTAFVLIAEKYFAGHGNEVSVYRTIRERDIDAGALFYSESDEAVRSIRKLGRLRNQSLKRSIH